MSSLITTKEKGAAGFGVIIKTIKNSSILIVSILIFYEIIRTLKRK